ncbi:MAG: VWA domain-containing protein [Candidatus Eisenbacteria bacterium]|uniref:VWA domain-containing protein n=1 Tax=Eiseniibacteriota bacterium TaxID=2212470 RepID=A0A538U2A1_UNCEI|nr:MAG: VWA domain-containing protein [Candidatus Eisenbacteria bacterium]
MERGAIWLWAALLGPWVVALAWLRERQGRAVIFPGVARLKGRPAGPRVALRQAPIVLAGLGLMIAALALARPQHGSLRESQTTRGIDIIVALDVSGSMAAEDFQPLNRIAVAKQVVAEFVRRRVNDRIGLVVFAGKSLTKSPPTTDVAVLLRQLDDVHLDMLPDGTAIGSGLATSLTRLRRSQAKSKVIVLVTDGANNAGEIDPATATDLARAMEVRVYTIGVGRGGQVPMPMQVQDPFTGRVSMRTMMTEVQIDEGLLERIADRTGGEFFRATDSQSLRNIFDRIDRLEKSEIKLAAYRRYREWYVPVLLTAAGTLATAGALWAVGFRVTPV